MMQSYMDDDHPGFGQKYIRSAKNNDLQILMLARITKNIFIQVHRIKHHFPIDASTA